MSARGAKREYNLREKAVYHEYVETHGPIRGGQKAFRRIKSGLPLYRRPLDYLSFLQQRRRANALEALSQSRRLGVSLTRASMQARVTAETIRRYTGAFRKRGRRWLPTSRDRIQRWLKSYEHGQRIEVLVDDSRTATLLSKHAHAVSRYLLTHDPDVFLPFRDKIYVDGQGVAHTFETRPEAILSAIERSEADFGAFVDLYSETEDESEAA